MRHAAMKPLGLFLLLLASKAALAQRARVQGCPRLVEDRRAWKIVGIVFSYDVDAP